MDLIIINKLIKKKTRKFDIALSQWVVNNPEICREAFMDYISQIDIDNHI
jgi:hypothetical protein